MFPVLCKHLVEAAGWNATLEDLEPDDHVFREIERIPEIGTNEKTQGYFREVERDGMAAGHGVLEKTVVVDALGYVYVIPMLSVRLNGLIRGETHPQTTIPHVRKLVIKFIRKPCVIGVHERDEIAGNVFDTGIARLSRTNVVLVGMNRDTTILILVFLRKSKRCVRRAIFDHDELPVLIGLRKNGVEGLDKIRLSIVEGHND